MEIEQKKRIYLPRKIGVKNPKFIRTDNFNFANITDAIGNISNAVNQVSNTVGQVANTVNQVSTTVKNVGSTVNTATGTVKGVIGQIQQAKNNLLNQTTYNPPAPPEQPKGFFDSPTNIALVVGGGLVFMVLLMVILTRK